MKNHLPALVATLIVAVLLIAFKWSAVAMQTPSQKLESLMAPSIEEAQRILANYAPDAGFLASILTPDEWDDEAHEPASDEVIPASVQSSLQLFERLDREHSQALRAARRDTPTIRRQGRPPTTVHPTQLPSDLETESQRLDQALDAVNQAMSMSAGTGPDAVSGRTHPVPTRLKAILLNEKADLLRRRAAVQHDMAEEARHGFRAQYTQWREVDARIRALEHRLKGGILPELSSPLDSPPAGELPEERAEPAWRTADSETPTENGSEETGSFIRLFQKIITPDDDHGTPPGMRDPEPARDGVPDPAFAPDEPSPPMERKARRHTPDPLVTIDEQRDRLTRQLEELEPRIAQSQERVDRLERQVDDVRARLEDTLARRKEAEASMDALRDQKLDPLVPDALERFTNAFERASADFRQAEKEAQLLERGGYRNAQFSTDDEERMLSEPLIPTEPDAELERVEGLNALEKELQAARETLDAEIALRSELEKQRENLEQEREQITKALEEYRVLRSRQRDRALAHAGRALAHAVEALRLEDQALEMVTHTAPAAVSAARNAAATEARETSEFVRSHPPIEGRAAPRLDYLPQYTALHEADLAWLHARIEAQRARALERHAGMLDSIDHMGITTASLLPEGADPDGVPPFTLQAGAARQESERAYEQMQAAAKDALATLDDSPPILSEKWFVGAGKAAISYFLAQNARTPEDAEKWRDEALQLYQRIPADAAIADGLQQVRQGLELARP